MEKKSILAILLIFAIIVICVMGGYIYKLYSEKQVNEIETDKLKTEITNLNNKNNELQEKIDNVSNAINSNTTKEDSFSKLNDDEATEILKNRFEIYFSILPYFLFK